MLGYIVAGALFIVLIGIFSRFRPAGTQKITDKLSVIRCAIVNAYVYDTGGGIIMFDTGTGPAPVKKGLKKLGLAPEAVTHVFLTHSDYDHAGGLSAFPGAERFISAEEEQMINGATARRGVTHNKPFSPYRTMADGETAVIGGTAVEMHLTPGHTPGSAVYMVDGRYLVTGDLLRVYGKGKIKPFLRLMNMRHKQDIESAEAARPLIGGAEYILTGHTGFCKL